MTPSETHLPCGAELDSLVIQVAETAPPTDPAHQATCPYCQTAMRNLCRSWEDVRALTREPVLVPAALTAQIMARVRTLARHLTDSLLLGGPHGETRINHAVVGQVAQRIARTVPGVVFASARPIPHDPPEPDRLDVALRLVVTFGPAIESLAHAVRSMLVRRVGFLTGAELSRIDISIEDIDAPPG